MSVEKSIKEKLQRIFDLQKVTFDKPSESNEQEGIFVAIANSHFQVKDAREVARLDGSIHVYANADKLPIGYFSKRIDAAAIEDTRGFFFGPEENMGTIQNIVERKFDFTFLYDSQYDPAIGTITSLTTSLTES
jgi:hypothetical protein